MAGDIEPRDAVTDAYRDAWIAEMWAPVREYHDPRPSLIPALYDTPANGSVDVVDNPVSDTEKGAA